MRNTLLRARQSYLVAVTSLVADLEGFASYDECRALRQAGEGAGHGTRAVVVNDGKRCAHGCHETERHVEFRAVEANRARDVDLIVTRAGVDAVQGHVV